jgi:hypothetical protein
MLCKENKQNAVTIHSDKGYWEDRARELPAIMDIQRKMPLSG